VGGDGYCQEAVSALLQRPDAEAARQRPIGFVPVGTSNTLMNGMIDTEDRDRRKWVPGRLPLTFARYITLLFIVGGITTLIHIFPSLYSLAHAAARGIVCGESRLVDVIEIEWEDYEQPTYALVRH